MFKLLPMLLHAAKGIGKGAGAVGQGIGSGLMEHGGALLKDKFSLAGGPEDSFMSRLGQEAWNRARESEAPEMPMNTMQMLRLPSVRGSNSPRRRLTARPVYMGGHNTMNYVRGYGRE